jgi:hypothetical protein
MTDSAQATLVVEYPCDQFCRIEVELSGEHGQVTLQQLRDKADAQHRRIHEPESAEAEAEDAAEEPVVDPEASRRPAATVFRSAPGRGVERDEQQQRSRPSRRFGR